MVRSCLKIPILLLDGLAPRQVAIGFCESSHGSLSGNRASLWVVMEDPEPTKTDFYKGPGFACSTHAGLQAAEHLFSSQQTAATSAQLLIALAEPARSQHGSRSSMSAHALPGWCMRI